ncbi:MAG: mycofactocin biosynthesis peptidyl-dipeptidase MftE [Gordonia sp. (in: high G+C Gram-positive bacteria)]
MTRPAALGQCRWPELDDSSVTLLVPVGALEQHGPHLPLDTDTRIAVAVTRDVHTRLADSSVLVAPEVGYGASGEHEGFPGTISLGHEALHALLLEFGRSACRWARRILFVNGHGGNAHTVAGAAARLRYEGRDAAWYPCAFPGADAHAGKTETALLLHISPEVVHSDKAVAGNVAPIGTLLPQLRSGGVAAVSETGVLGDPDGANAGEGAALLEYLTGRLTDAVGRWQVGADGRLT